MDRRSTMRGQAWIVGSCGMLSFHIGLGIAGYVVGGIHGLGVTALIVGAFDLWAAGRKLQSTQLQEE